MITNAIFRRLPSPRPPNFNVDAFYPTAGSKKKMRVKIVAWGTQSMQH